MNADIKKRGLGRGLDALFQDARAEESVFEPKIKRADEIVSAPVSSAPQATAVAPQRKLPVEKLRPGQFQPRTHFDEAALDALAESIAVHGILQPILVRPVGGNMFEIIAGERRWRAAQKARIHEVPVVVQDMGDNDALEIALIENLQREDLDAIEEAEGYQRLMDEFHHTQDVMAHRLGKSRSHVANMLRLLKLSPKVKHYVQTRQMSAGHARTLVGVEGADRIADVIVKRGLNVRQTEKLLKKVPGKEKPGVIGKKPVGARSFIPRDVDVLALEEKISSILGMRVIIDGVGPEGTVTIEYRSLDQMDDIISRLSQTPNR